MNAPPEDDKKRKAGNTNVVDKFMLQEYKSIAAAHFDSQAGLRKQFRFYLLIVTVPLTIVGFVNRSTSPQLDIFDLPPLVTYVFLGIGILGVLMLLSMIHIFLDAILYARTVNGVRDYFVQRGQALMIPIEVYLKMPHDQTRPNYFDMRSFFWQALLIALINTAYFALFLQTRWHMPLVTIFTMVSLLVIQLGAYPLFAWHRQQQEVTR